jgi:hypothetical protein
MQGANRKTYGAKISRGKFGRGILSYCLGSLSYFVDLLKVKLVFVQKNICQAERKPSEKHPAGGAGTRVIWLGLTRTFSKIQTLSLNS